MPKEFKSKYEPLKTHTFNLKVTHIEYLQTIPKYNEFVRWVFDNLDGYKKFMKEKKR